MKYRDTAEPITHRRYLERLLTLNEGRTALNYKLLPSARDFIGAGVGVGGLSFRYVVGEDKSRVELFIARSDASANDKIFSELLSHKREIEAAFGEQLSWERLEDSKSCRIAHRISGGVKDAEANWQVVQAAMIDAMIRFEKALLPFIENTAAMK